MNDLNNISWQESLLRKHTHKEKLNRQDFEDLRSADWQYYLPINNCGSALIFGSGLGVIPIALSKQYSNILVLDNNQKKIELLKKRIKSSSLTNVHTSLISSIKNLSLKDKSFDMVFWNANNTFDKSLNAKSIVSFVSQYVKDNGILCISLRNHYSLIDRIFSDSDLLDNNSIKLKQCKSILNNLSYHLICILCPLPHIKGIPLFYIPTDNNDCLNYFLRVLSVRFLGISPELKRFYKIEYALTKIVIMICNFFSLGSIIKYFLPGYMIIAEKTSSDS